MSHADPSAERERLLSLLVKRAEQKASIVVVGTRVVSWAAPPWHRIAESVAAYPTSRSTMLRARTVAPELPVVMLDVALAAELGQGVRRPTKRGARRRLRDLLVIANALRGLGEGLRFGELLAATLLPEARLAHVLRWAQRHHVLFDAGERGWFFNSVTVRGAA